MLVQQEPVETKRGPEDYFESGLLHLRKHRARKALDAFRVAVELKPDEPRYMSYFGLCLAIAANRPHDAAPLCEKALRKEQYRPELYANLGRVYLVTGNARKAYHVFTQGLKLDADNPDINHELRKMGQRRRPVFAGLDRGHALNRYVGLMLCRMGVR